MKPYLLTFCTEGPPHDECYDLTECGSQIRDRLSPYFEEIFVFTPRTLKELPGSEEFCNSWPEPLDMNPNANHVGYFDFKGFLIKHVMQKLPEGAILMYHDGNFKKNPQYWVTDWPNISEILNLLLGMHCQDLFFQFEQQDVKVKNHVKGYVLETFFPDWRERHVIANSMLIGAARIIVRNSEFSRKFIDEYTSHCLNKKLVAKTPTGSVDPDFRWSCGDQDVLNALVYRYILDGKLNPKFPGVSFLYRVMRLDLHQFTWKFDNWEPWHDRPHPTGLQFLLNDMLIQFEQERKRCNTFR